MPNLFYFSVLCTVQVTSQNMQGLLRNSTFCVSCFCTEEHVSVKMLATEELSIYVRRSTMYSHTNCMFTASKDIINTL